MPSRRELAYSRDEREEDAREESFGEVDASSVQEANEGEVTRSRQVMEGEPGISAKGVSTSWFCSKACHQPPVLNFGGQAGGDQKIPQDPSCVGLKAAQQWCRLTPQMGEVEAAHENVG